MRVPARSAVEVEPPTLRPHGPFADDVPGLGLRVEREQLIVRVGLDGGAPGLGDGPPRQRLETRGQRGELGGVVGGFRKGGGVGCGGGCSCLGLGRGVGEGLPEAGAGRWAQLCTAQGAGGKVVGALARACVAPRSPSLRHSELLVDPIGGREVCKSK